MCLMMSSGAKANSPLVWLMQHWSLRLFKHELLWQVFELYIKPTKPLLARMALGGEDGAEGSFSSQ